jgi:hypothetical protein
VNRTKLAAFIGVPFAFLMLTSQPLFAAPTTRAAADASVQPATAQRFGAKLTSDLFPDNAAPAHTCAEPSSCTWAMNQAKNRTNGAAAPRDGKISKIRLIAGEAGHFKLQFVTVKNGKWTAVKGGPTITYSGQPATAGSNVVIESFNVNIAIKKGWHLAAKASSLSILSCNSGSPNVYQFQPGLVVGDSARTPDDHDGCFLLLEAQYAS